MYKNYTKKQGILKGYVHKIPLIMRLTIILLITTMMQVSAASYAQRISLNTKNATLLEVFKEIRVQSGYDFMFDRQLIANANPVSINLSNASLNEVLKRCFEQQSFTYTIEDKTIVIKTKDKSLLDNLVRYFKSITVTGVLLNEKGQPMPGASIKVKGANRFTSTNATGSFTLTNVDENAEIVISFIGYEPKELKVKADLGTIALVMANSKLDEVQVQAYGQISRRLNTGNITTVTAADIEKQPVNNVLLALEGRVPGLFITQTTGLPNAAVQVKIRGTNTISQSKDPLYVVDGLPYTPTLISIGSGNSGVSNPLSFINPASIESVNVLKDADATAIYGSRGANGVILITTKKGVAGNAKFDLNVYTGISRIPSEMDLMNTDEFLNMRREAFKNDGITPTASNAPDLFNWDPTRNVDWEKRLLNNVTLSTNAQLSMSGGAENTQYRIFGGYVNTAPPFDGNFSSQKVSGGITLSTSTLDKRFRAQFSVNYLSDQTYLPSYDPTTNIFLAPNAPDPINADGSVNFKDYAANPMAGFKNWNRTKTNNLIANTNLSYVILPSLTLRVTGGYNTINVKGNQANTIAQSAGDPNVSNATGSAVFSNNTVLSWIVEPQISFQKRILKGNFEALIGTTFQQNKSDGQVINGSGYTNDALLTSLAAASAITKGTSVLEVGRFNSVYGRLNYNYDEKYLINLTGRRDGSSRFGPDKRFGNFGAIGAGWIFSKENLIAEQLPFLSFGKLRASYGVTGNEPSANYKYSSLHTFQTPARPYQGAQAITTDNLLYSDYAWEEVRKLEGGLELGFLKDRIIATFSYFKNNSSNQLINYKVPSTTGFTTVLLNWDADIQNTGMEMTLSTVNVKSPNFRWKSEFNLTFSKNKLVSFPGIATSSYSSTYKVGLPLSVQARYIAAGVNPQTGVYQFYDKNGNLTYTPENSDATDYTSFDPKFYGGLSNSFTYKQFSLDVFFQFVKQKGADYFYNTSGSSAPGYSVYGSNNQPTQLLNRWQKPGDITPYEKYTSQSGSDAANALFYQAQSTAAITDASYIRLKTLSFSYELPANISRKFKADRARIYAQGQNLLTITPYKGIDPESQSFLPPLSVWTIGIQLTF